MKSIIALLVALSAGGIGGWSLGTQATLAPQTDIQQTVEHTEIIPVAEDFLSLRPALANLPAETLSEAEENGLIFMREEEKLARDVYSTLYDAWGLKIFTNIAQSEQTHTEAIRDLLTKYKINDPVVDDTVGVFTNPELQTLYDSLVMRGEASLEEALIVGALIEELDIRDLQSEIDMSDNQDIDLVYENLLRGSRNHLRAFMKQLDKRDVEYDPQYISGSEFERIIASDQETGRQAQPTGGSNQGTRQGWGQGRNNY